MDNPFDAINKRLSSIENMLFELKQQPLEVENENLTVKETAQYLKVSEQSIHNYIRRGLIKARKVGRILLIDKLELDKCLSEVKSLKYKRT